MRPKATIALAAAAVLIALPGVSQAADAKPGSGGAAASAASNSSSSSSNAAPTAKHVVALRYGDAIKGSLDDDTDDMDDDLFDFDAYSFTGRAGEQVTIAAQSDDFDTFVELYDPSNHSIAYDDDGGDGLDSLLRYTLPRDGTYRFDVLASDDFEAEGDYVVTLSGPGATAMAANARPAPGAPASSGATTSSASPVRITYGQTMRGKLAAGDAVDDGKKFFDIYTFVARAGETAVITAASDDFDAELFLFDPDTKLLIQDDDGNGGLSPKITYRIPRDGTYRVDILSSGKATDTGAYSLTLNRQ